MRFRPLLALTALALACAHGDPAAPWRKEGAPLIPLESAEGQRLLDEVQGRAQGLEALRAAWVPQLPAHCGAASAVTVMNALDPGLRLTQDSLFTPETDHIITQETVYDIGFTNDELVAMIKARSGLEATNFRAGSASGEHTVDEFIEALLAADADPGSAVIVQLAYNHLRTGRNTGGHFSPVAAYHAEREMALFLEVASRRPMLWIPVRDLYAAMAQTDPTDGRNRGWIVVRRR